jgi:tetratricopeptide (TPR) repeat protein
MNATWLLYLAVLAQSQDLVEQGNQALNTKQYERAVELYTKAAAADPKDPFPEFQIALIDNMLDRDSDAVPHYQAALQAEPGLYEAELNLGLTLLRIKDPAAALPHLEAAVAKKSTAPGEAGLARALARQRRLAESEAHFRKAASLDASYKDAILELAGLFEADGKRAEAIAIYREFPQNPGAQERLGGLLRASGNDADAIPALEAAVAKSPTGANMVALAQAYLRTKQPEKAQAMGAKLVAQAPDDVELRMFYGRILRDQRKFPDAASEFMAAARIRPDLAEAWSELAAALVIAGQYPQGLAALDRVRALGAESAGHYFQRALALDHLQQRPEAVENYNKFLASSQGKFPDQEFQARQRVRVLETEMKKR